MRNWLRLSGKRWENVRKNMREKVTRGHIVSGRKLALENISQEQSVSGQNIDESNEIWEEIRAFAAEDANIRRNGNNVNGANKRSIVERSTVVILEVRRSQPITPRRQPSNSIPLTCDVSCVGIGRVPMLPPSPVQSGSYSNVWCVIV